MNPILDLHNDWWLSFDEDCRPDFEDSQEAFISGFQCALDSLEESEGADVSPG